MLRQNNTANSKGYFLGTVLVGTHLDNACIVPHNAKCEHTTQLVLLNRSATEVGPRLGKKGKQSNNTMKYVYQSVFNGLLKNLYLLIICLQTAGTMLK